MHVPPIRRWLVEAAQRIDAALGPARVERLALPPLMDDPGKEGEFCAVQLDDGSVGLAFTLLEGTLARLHARDAPAAGAAAIELVQRYAAGDAPARTVGLAAINALARRLYEGAGFVPEDSIDSFGSLALASGDRLGMVGHFGSLISQARALDVPVTVLELRPELVLWRGAEAVAIVGPSAGCPPDPLFAAGVSSVGTVWVADADGLVARIAAGEKWGASSRKVTLSRGGYPGIDALLGKAGRA